MVTFIGHFEKIRAGLERANSSFNEAASSFQTRVRPAGERLAELGAGIAGKELADVQPLEITPNLPPALADMVMQPAPTRTETDRPKHARTHAPAKIVEHGE